jgi:hypothetical protein
MKEIFRESSNLEKLGAVVFRLSQPQLQAVSFLLQTGEPQTKALNHRRYSRARATTS